MKIKQDQVNPEPNKAEVDKRLLAAQMLEWADLHDELMSLSKTIAQKVLALGETVVVGDIRARYSKGRDKLDYETPGKSAAPEIIEGATTKKDFYDVDGLLAKLDDENSPLLDEFLRIKELVDWAMVCKDANLDPIVVEPGRPAVTLMIDEPDPAK